MEQLLVVVYAFMVDAMTLLDSQPSLISVWVAVLNTLVLILVLMDYQEQLQFVRWQLVEIKIEFG